jgi:16S rRNA (cytosine1402-N4)-methyltransferase
MDYHVPVLADESVDYLLTRPDGIFVDVTFGGGGHSRLILDQLSPTGQLFGFDQDPDAAANALSDDRFTFVAANFRDLRNYLRLYGVERIDGLLADLGVSSHQFDAAERGFSFRFDAPLDMRMNQEGARTAADLVNELSAEDLQYVLGQFGEVRNARTLAHAIVAARTTRPVRTIGDFLTVVDPLVRGQRNRYLAQVFQALRIAVNDEMEALSGLLQQATELLGPGGRLVVISYHSLEDRLVKNFLRAGRADGKPEKDFYGNIDRPYRILTRKPVQPSEEEITRNPRARSAKLRVGERVGGKEESK